MKIQRMRISAKPIREAMLFVAKNDCRAYLKGVFIEPNSQVTATNGHFLYTAKAIIDNAPEEFKDDDFKGMILRIHGIVLKSAMNVDLSINGLEGFVVVKNRRGEEIQRLAATLVDDKYPDYKQVLPSEDSHKNLTNKLCLNAKFMATVVRIFPEGMRIKYEDGNSAIIFTDASELGDGAPIVLIMPLRDD